MSNKLLSFLDKERTVAGPGFNRWLVPPAALAIHLCIGMAYGFSVFWLPLSKAVGVKESVPCSAETGFFQELFATGCDWKVSTLGWLYTLFFVFLGCSAAIWGGWLEHEGPRKGAFVSALCWCGGLLISALGVHLHLFWLVLLGSGVIGGIGLGLGYLSPISTLLKWFPDRRGMATGMAVMGFGGGAMVGSPLATGLMNSFSSPTSVGVAQTFATLAAVYFVFMMVGAFAYRVPPTDWKPEGWSPSQTPGKGQPLAPGHVHVDDVFRIKQFWLLWAVLCMNASAGIGVIGMASPMLQEVFGGRLIGISSVFSQLTKEQIKAVAMSAAGFTALLSLFNIAGRFLWGSLSDKLGRKRTYQIFFVLGILLYLLAAYSAKSQSLFLFVAALCVIVSMYGGGFASLPAYLADLFGTQMVTAINGRLLTAWATAGVLGPVVVNYMRETQLAMGIPREIAYAQTMVILCCLLTVGLVCSSVIKPIDQKWFMSEERLNEERKLAHEAAAKPQIEKTGQAKPVSPLLVAAAWTFVLVPMLWGVAKTLISASSFFK